MKIKVKLWVGQHPSLHYFETHHLLKEVGYKWVRKHARGYKMNSRARNKRIKTAAEKGDCCGKT